MGKFPVLISYAYWRKHDQMAQLFANDPNIDVLLDCGAFTAYTSGKPIALQDYLTFLDREGSKIFRYLALDVIANPEATEANLQEMLRGGYKPVPVHVLGDDQRRMDQLFEYSDYVALGGVLRPGKGHASHSYVIAKMKWAAGRNVHWLGFVRSELFSGLKPYSCDSSSWSQANMYGLLHVYAGNGRWVKAVKYKDRHIVARDTAAMAILREFGYTASDLNNEVCWRMTCHTASMTMIITIDSWVRWAIDIYKRYGVRVFLAAGLSITCLELHAAINRHVHKLDAPKLITGVEA